MEKIVTQLLSEMGRELIKISKKSQKRSKTLLTKTQLEISNNTIIETSNNKQKILRKRKFSLRKSK